MNTTAHNRTALRFRFAFHEPRGTRPRNRTRAQVAEHVTQLADAEIVAEHSHDRRCYVAIRLPRPVRIKVAAEHLGECPNYVKGSFEWLGE